jgi:hypothetical protein
MEDNIINLVEILEEKERQEELQEEMEKAELRDQLRWVLQKLHEKNITYEAEDEQEMDLDAYERVTPRNWFQRFLDRFRS